MLTVAVLPVLLAASEPTPPQAPADRAIPIKAVAEKAAAMYRTQVLADLDRPVGSAITLAGRTIAARTGEKGELELDLAGDGKWKSYSRASTVATTIDLPAADGKTKAMNVSLYVQKGADGGWLYRNITQLAIRVGQEGLMVVDVDGDGLWNEAGVDGMAWAGQEWLWPLPAGDERFATRTLDLTGLAFGPQGQDAALSGRPLATTVAETLPILRNTNDERVRIGLTPRPENAKLSADLQKHCAYMALNKTLTHPEDSGKPGYSKEGHNAGMRSILSMGTAPERIATMMVETYFHRQDVIRPETRAFGVGFDGGYGGIDGRSDMDKSGKYRWPVLWPVPDMTEVAMVYQKEAPDATPGDGQAGIPITVFFGSGKPTLASWKLVALDGKAAGQPIDCYPFDAKTGASPDMTGYQRCVCIIPKDPLQGGLTYEVSIAADTAGGRWERTWRFATVGGGKRK